MNTRRPNVINNNVSISIACGFISIACGFICGVCIVLMFSSFYLLLAPITKTRLFKYIENFTTKNENFQMKNSGSFHISAQNIDCGYLLQPPRRGGSNKYPQSMFLSRNKKNNVYLCKPQFYCIKVGFKGVKTI